jgi:hypothetical protein
MKKHGLVVFIILVSSIFRSAGFAAERMEFFNGVRALGMGGAVVAVANDETALLSNPAALGKLRDFYITVADPELDISEDTQAIVGGDITAFMDPQDTVDKIKNKPTRNMYQRAQVFPSVVLPNFGIGLFAKYEMSAHIDATSGNIEMNYVNDIAAVMGFNIRLFDGVVKIGGSGRLINRTTLIREDILTSETALSIDSSGQEGVGVAGDAAIMLAAPITWLPTIGVVYRDIGHTRYDMGSGVLHSTSDSPDSTRPTLDVAFAVFPIIGKTSRMTVTGELRDIMKNMEDGKSGRQEDDISRRIHAGLEFNFSDVFFLRAGMNQRYWTAGAELALFNYQLQLASYGEDIGTADDPEEDRRYVAKFAWRF